MLSYQHQYHAGNHADVLKHWLLLECVQYMKRKDKPFDYIDTHAGAGIYNLESAEALKTNEAKEGILKLEHFESKGLEDYFSVVKNYLAHKQYPGSPALVKEQLRRGDKAWLFELHPQTFTALEENCAQRRLIHVKKQNGFEGLLSLLPNQARRALVLIDPSFEIKSDYQTVVKVMEKAYLKMPNVTILLWYPVVDREKNNTMETAIKQSKLKNVQLFELGIKADDNKGMTASGMICVNPPWTLAHSFNQTMPEVAENLSTDGQRHIRFEQLIEE